MMWKFMLELIADLQYSVFENLVVLHWSCMPEIGCCKYEMDFGWVSCALCVNILHIFVRQGWGSILIALLRQKAAVYVGSWLSFGTELRTEWYMQTFQHLFSLGLLGCWDVGRWEALLPTGIYGRLWHASKLIRVGVDACAESCVPPSLRTVWCLSAMCCASCLLPLQSKCGSESRIPRLRSLSPFLSLFPLFFIPSQGRVLFDHRGCFSLGFKTLSLRLTDLKREWREEPQWYSTQALSNYCLQRVEETKPCTTTRNAELIGCSQGFGTKLCLCSNSLWGQFFAMIMQHYCS